MKKHFINVMIVASGLAATACGSPKNCGDKAAAGTPDVSEVAVAEDDIMGAWAPIVLSKTEVTFPRKGGEATVTCTNYDSWWINDVQVVGEDMVTHADPGPDNTYRTLKADGISAEIVEDNKVKITVEGGAAARKWDLHMESGDAFTTIKIIKKGK